MSDIDDNYDDELMCGCRLCATVEILFTFANVNYAKFIIISSLLQLVYGYYYCDSLIYIIGYINQIYMLMQLNHKFLLIMVTFILIPIYFSLQLCNASFPPLFLDMLVIYCILLQMVGACIKTFVYLNKMIRHNT